MALLGNLTAGQEDTYRAIFDELDPESILAPAIENLDAGRDFVRQVIGCDPSAQGRKGVCGWSLVSYHGLARSDPNEYRIDGGSGVRLRVGAAKDLADGWAAVWLRPMWGYGTGCAAGERWQPHNQVVAIWLELGIFGVLIYALQLLVPTVMCAMGGFRQGWCLLPAFLDIPCLHWLPDMPMFWLSLAVCYAELFKHRVEFRVSDEAPLSHAGLCLQSSR